MRNCEEQIILDDKVKNSLVDKVLMLSKNNFLKDTKDMFGIKNINSSDFFVHLGYDKNKNLMFYMTYPLPDINNTVRQTIENMHDDLHNLYLKGQSSRLKYYSFKEVAKLANLD